MCERCYDPESVGRNVFNDFLLCDTCYSDELDALEQNAPEGEEPTILELVWAFERGEIRF